MGIHILSISLSCGQRVRRNQLVMINEVVGKNDLSKRGLWTT